MDAAHPLAALLSRWREQAGVRHLRLDNLPVPSLVAMVAEMLHVDPAAAAGLVEVIEPHTSGNPYETVELLNALRRDGVLTATAAGWRWDAAAVRAHLGRSEVAGLLAARVEAMPAPSRQLVEAMACLGGRAELSLLQTATGEPASVVDQRLAPALDEGVLVVEPGARQAVRFRHDRIREAVLAGLDPQRRRALQLAMARRLAGGAGAVRGRGGAVPAGGRRGRRRRGAASGGGLLRRAADQARLIGDHALVNALLGAALRLIDPGETATLIEVHTGRHAALYSLGRLEEADEEYRTIEGLCADRAGARGRDGVQVRSLTHRNRFGEAVGLAWGRCESWASPSRPRTGSPPRSTTSSTHLYRWLDHTDAADDLARPEITDPALLAATRLINAVLPAAYFAADHAAMRLAEPGGAADLAGARPGPYPGRPGEPRRLCGRGAARRLRRRVPGGAADPGAGEARGYEPDTSQARFLFALTCWWFEPIENAVQEAQRAREGLIAGGDSGQRRLHLPRDRVLPAGLRANAGRLRRRGGGRAGLRAPYRQRADPASRLDSYRWLAGVAARREPRAVGGGGPTDRYADNPLALLDAHLTRAVAAAIFGDPVGLARHTAAAMPLLPDTRGLPTRPPWRACCAGWPSPGRPAPPTVTSAATLLAELDELIAWLAARAADAPDNFLHLLRLLEAERAWAVGDFRAAALAFDAARREVARRQRPWHRALITERAARFSLAHGLEHAGYDLLAQARHEYVAWGATAKVAQLDWAYPALRPGADTTARLGHDPSAEVLPQRSTVTTGTLDLLGILSASQALSSETSIERLHARVVEVLGALTGATGVHLLLWSDDRHDWLLPRPGGAVPVSGTGHGRARADVGAALRPARP